MNEPARQAIGLILVFLLVGSFVFLFTPLGTVTEDCSDVKYSCEDMELAFSTTGEISTGSAGSFATFDPQDQDRTYVDLKSYNVSLRSPESDSIQTVKVKFSYIDSSGETVETDDVYFYPGVDDNDFTISDSAYPFVERVEYEIVSVEIYRYEYYTVDEI